MGDFGREVKGGVGNVWKAYGKRMAGRTLEDRKATVQWTVARTYLLWDKSGGEGGT